MRRAEQGAERIARQRTQAGGEALRVEPRAFGVRVCVWSPGKKARVFSSPSAS